MPSAQCELHLPAAFAALFQPSHVVYGLVTLSKWDKLARVQVIPSYLQLQGFILWT